MVYWGQSCNPPLRRDVYPGDRTANVPALGAGPGKEKIMVPNQLDADVEMHYRIQRARRDAESFRLARLAAGPGVAGAWQIRLAELREAGQVRLAGWLAALIHSWELFCRWVAGLGVRSNCNEAPA